MSLNSMAVNEKKRKKKESAAYGPVQGKGKRLARESERFNACALTGLQRL